MLCYSAKIVELDDSGILNESNSSSIEDKEDVCKKWADLQVLSLLNAGLREKTEYGKGLLQKVQPLGLPQHFYCSHIVV